MKLAAVIVTYFPDFDDLENNVGSLLSEVGKIIIWENTPGASMAKSDRFLAHNDKIIYLGTGENVGIATALNNAVEWVAVNGYTHLLTMDQDSYFSEGHLLAYKKLIDDDKDNQIGVYGINPVSGGVSLFNPGITEIIVPDTITSGSIFPLTIFKECGLFMDSLFIDAVDYEYCYRVMQARGYKTRVFPAILLQHKIGYMTKTRWGFRTDNYSAFRTYFIVRNQLYVWLKYPRIFPRSHKIMLVKTHIIFRFIKVLLAEPDKFHKIKAICYGLFHGLTNKSGYYKI